MNDPAKGTAERGAAEVWVWFPDGRVPSLLERASRKAAVLAMAGAKGASRSLVRAAGAVTLPVWLVMACLLAILLVVSIDALLPRNSEPVVTQVAPEPKPAEPPPQDAPNAVLSGLPKPWRYIPPLPKARPDSNYVANSPVLEEP